MYRGRIVEHGADRRRAAAAAARVHAASALRRRQPRSRAAARRRGRAAAGRRRDSPHTGGTPTSPRRSSRSDPATSSGASSADELPSGADAVHAARRVRARLRGDAARGRARSATRASSCSTCTGTSRTRCAALLDELGLAVCGRHASLEEIESDLDGAGGRAAERSGRDRLVLAWIEPPATAHEADAVVARIAALADRRARSRAPARLPQPRRRAAPARRRSHRPRPAGRARRGAALLRSRPRVGVVRRGRAGGAARAPRAACAVRPRQGSRDRAASAASCPVGDGGVGYRSCCRRSEALGVEWLLVEQDEVDGPALDAVRRSFAAVTDMVGSAA